MGEKLWAKKCEEESGDQAVVSQKPKSPSQRRHEEGMAVMQGTCVCSALVCAARQSPQRACAARVEPSLHTVGLWHSFRDQGIKGTGTGQLLIRAAFFSFFSRFFPAFFCPRSGSRPEEGRG